MLFIWFKCITNFVCVPDTLEFSDGGSEGSLEEVRQHHGIIKTQKQDDPDYLTLFEAHQRRLEDVGSPSTGTES